MASSHPWRTCINISAQENMLLPQCAAQLSLSHFLWLRMLAMLRWPGCFAEIHLEGMKRDGCVMKRRMSSE